MNIIFHSTPYLLVNGTIFPGKNLGDSRLQEDGEFQIGYNDIINMSMSLQHDRLFVIDFQNDPYDCYKNDS